MPDYVVDDHIFLEWADLHLNHPSNKLGFKRFGSFQVVSKISDSDSAYWWVLLDAWTIHDVFHVSYLIPMCEDTLGPLRGTAATYTDRDRGGSQDQEDLAPERRGL